MTVKNKTLGFFNSYKEAKNYAEKYRKYYKNYTMKIIKKSNGLFIANFSKYNFFEKLLKIVF